MNVEQVSYQKTVKVTITLVVASNICSQTRPRPLNIHSTFVLGSPKNTETPVPGWGGETTGPSGATRSASWAAVAGPNTTHFIGTSSEVTAQLGSLFLLTLPVIYRPWCMRFIWKPCPHKLCTTLSASSIPQVFFLFVSDTGRHSRVSTRPAERKEHLCSCWCETNGPGRTFRALPCVPQVLHADELVISVEAVVLGLGVVVVQVFPQELKQENDV